MYLAAQHKLFTESVDWAQLWKIISPKSTKNIQQMNKSCDKKTFRDLEHVCPKKDDDIRLIVVVEDNFAWTNIIIFIIHLAYTRKYSTANLRKKIESI